jgi:hypothetical protein
VLAVFRRIVVNRLENDGVGRRGVMDRIDRRSTRTPSEKG